MAERQLPFSRKEFFVPGEDSNGCFLLCCPSNWSRVPRLFLCMAARKQFSGSTDCLIADREEPQYHKKLENLCVSTRSAKNFQRDIVRGVEAYIGLGSKKVEIGHRLSEDSMKYGVDHTCTSSSNLSKAALSYARARALIEKEHGNLLKALSTQVTEPLRAMIVDVPLEDARQLAKRYDKMKQEAEAQVTEVSKRQQKLREASTNAESSIKLDTAEIKLQELRSNMMVLGKEAVAAMTDVASQQQRLTAQLLILMIEAERSYHRKIVSILEQLEGEMASERRMEASPSRRVENTIVFDSQSNGSIESTGFFLAEVMLSYQAETNVEINLSMGDYVVVRKVSNNGWAEGECKGKAGWFPFEYIEKRERVLMSKIANVY